ncbi:tRNA lysidine(34) synthetase TilS [Roseobacter sp. YSTF-M11]|uniref:tRNA(Ile)-lysidine synthase n=1 Tax=Roseobacter insulae TaxID=2859783 RepID=A0A9X1FV12_9RHOB|nr:tRNA lysidine(34) synthetase TilS [Roseobacter insulae]MBW4707635.1 tRNA lysidine(34) synthetase TilS [Roseobacter insulae]
MRRDLGGEVDKFLLPDPPSALGVAVSGGGDSMALLHLLHDFCQHHSIALRAVTVNHGLRPEAAEEVAFVAKTCASLNVTHSVLHWDEWDRQGNLQNEARKARYRLITAWAKAHGVSHIALGHTVDDQAETVLMRLARGSGVDGLTAMTPRRQVDGVTWMRPLLHVSRVELRQELNARGLSWRDDPSNDDAGFERIKMRQALDVLEPLGVDAPALAQVAENMARAREALNAHAAAAAKGIVSVEAGAFRIDWQGFDALPEETARRIFLRALSWISGADYPPRSRAVLRLMAALKAGDSGTLDGCRARRRDDSLWIYREYNPVRAVTCAVSGVWDNRWRVDAEKCPDQVHVGALGEDGLRQVPDWRATGHMREVLLATPAVWNGQVLVAAPLAGYTNGWRATLVKDEKAYFAALLSH